MTDSDDKIARRYRELAREQPPPALDAAILAKARRKTRDGPSFQGPEEMRVRPWFKRWAGPVSIAAVLVLGIGVSLRMQLERPGIETSAPAIESSPPSEYSVTPSAEPAPASAADAVDKAKSSAATSPARQNRLDADRPPKAFADEMVRERSRSEPAVPQAVPAAPPAPAFVPSPTTAPESALRAAPAPPAAVRAQEAPAAAKGAPLRAKREAAAQDSLGARDAESQGSLGASEQPKSVAPESDPDRELERIARLREAGSHAQADAALVEFRRRRPDHRIPEAMWERVKPR